MRDIIVIGASAGGIEAVSQMVAALPGDLPAALFVVVHIAPTGAGLLPDILNRAGFLPALNAVDGAPIKPGRIYMAPPDFHLLLFEGRMKLSHGPRENRHRPSVNVLFRSAARAFGSRVIGIILSGALDDGARGLQNVKDKGGIAIVQDPREAQHPGMPEAALRNGSVDEVLSIRQMAARIVELCKENVTIKPSHSNPRTTRLFSAAFADPDALD
jgi:two-component system chemotaxis response regulator CheB